MAPACVQACINVVKWGPVLFISAVVVWSYYAYVVELCIFTIPAENVAEKVIYLIIYHPLIFMFIWSYWQTIFTTVAKVPKQFYLSSQDSEKIDREDNDDNIRQILIRHGRNLPIQCRTLGGAGNSHMYGEILEGYRYCEKCKALKPDRAHHCSVCGCCVLKMDHHCPWVNNCVNFSNYKFFVLFLGYAFLYCLYVSMTTLKYFIDFWSKPILYNLWKIQIIFLFFVGIMFTISVVSLLGYHLYLVTLNRSTLESFRSPVFRTGPDKNGFHLGKLANFQEVFGDDKGKWFLPLFTSIGDGVTYSTRGGNTNATYNTMSSTTPPPVSPPQISMGDGVTYPTRTEDIESDNLLAQRQRWAEDGDLEDGETPARLSYTNELVTQEERM